MSSVPVFSNFAHIDSHVEQFGAPAINDLREAMFDDFNPSMTDTQRRLIKNWLAYRAEREQERVSLEARDLSRRGVIAAEESAAAARASAVSAGRSVFWAILAFVVSVAGFAWSVHATWGHP